MFSLSLLPMITDRSWGFNIDTERDVDRAVPELSKARKRGQRYNFETSQIVSRCSFVPFTLPAIRRLPSREKRATAQPRIGSSATKSPLLDWEIRMHRRVAQAMNLPFGEKLMLTTGASSSELGAATQLSDS